MVLVVGKGVHGNKLPGLPVRGHVLEAARIIEILVAKRLDRGNAPGIG